MKCCCTDNKLVLNTSETKEFNVDFREKEGNAHTSTNYSKAVAVFICTSQIYDETFSLISL